LGCVSRLEGRLEGKLLVGGLALDGLPDPHLEGVGSLEAAFRAWSTAFTRLLSNVMPMTALVLWEILPKNYYTVLDRNSEIHVSGLEEAKHAVPSRLQPLRSGPWPGLNADFNHRRQLQSHPTQTKPPHHHKTNLLN